MLTIFFSLIRLWYWGNDWMCPGCCPLHQKLLECRNYSRRKLLQVRTLRFSQKRSYWGMNEWLISWMITHFFIQRVEILSVFFQRIWSRAGMFPCNKRWLRFQSSPGTGKSNYVKLTYSENMYVLRCDAFIKKINSLRN